MGLDKPSEENSRTSSRNSSKKSGLLQVSDHPRMRHNSAENTENNYENFAHELSNNYLWNPVLSTKELSKDSIESVSPERRLDMVLDQFSESQPNPGLARPIPTFSGVQPDEVHRARPAYAPTPSPGGSEDSAPPLPARINNNQPVSLPFFPFHQFPGRSVKPMCKWNFG